MHMYSEGGFFNAILTFPPDYPQSPPTCRFTSEMWHPNGKGLSVNTVQCTSLKRTDAHRKIADNACKRAQDQESGNLYIKGSFLTVWCAPTVYADGRVCISILHNPGDDPHGYETASERWSPVHTVGAGLQLVEAISY